MSGLLAKPLYRRLGLTLASLTLVALVLPLMPADAKRKRHTTKVKVDAPKAVDLTVAAIRLKPKKKKKASTAALPRLKLAIGKKLPDNLIVLGGVKKLKKGTILVDVVVLNPRPRVGGARASAVVDPVVKLVARRRYTKRTTEAENAIEEPASSRVRKDICHAKFASLKDLEGHLRKAAVAALRKASRDEACDKPNAGLRAMLETGSIGCLAANARARLAQDTCPEKDTDGDGIPDSKDDCDFQKEDRLVNPNDGCPNVKPVITEVEASQIIDKTTFFKASAYDANGDQIYFEWSKTHPPGVKCGTFKQNQTLATGSKRVWTGQAWWYHPHVAEAGWTAPEDGYCPEFGSPGEPQNYHQGDITVRAYDGTVSAPGGNFTFGFGSKPCKARADQGGGDCRFSD